MIKRGMYTACLSVLGWRGGELVDFIVLFSKIIETTEISHALSIESIYSRICILTYHCFPSPLTLRQLVLPLAPSIWQQDLV